MGRLWCTLLASLLPGFRDVRSALVAGYMWVASFWLSIGYLWPELVVHKTILREPILQLLGVLGSAGSLIALSLLCLVVGESASGLIQRVFFGFSLHTFRG